MTLTISALGRIQTTAILGQQRVDVKNLYVLADLHKKLELTDDDRAKLLRDAGGGQMIIDNAAMKEFGDTEIELETAEARKLREVLNGFTGYSPTDAKWLEPVLKSLESI